MEADTHHRLSVAIPRESAGEEIRHLGPGLPLPPLRGERDGVRGARRGSGTRDGVCAPSRVSPGSRSYRFCESAPAARPPHPTLLPPERGEKEHAAASGGSSLYDKATEHKTENRRTAGKTGFTVVEVVAALAILALALGVLLNVTSDSLRRTERAETIAEAGSLAQSLLAETGVELPLQDGETTGETDRGFRWRVHIEPYGDGTDRREWPVAAHQVLAEVSWRDGQLERSLVLTTLRLGPKEPVR